ncbi:VOC family protein [Dactylosporangium sp. CS-047395]|uniref:VOC family protein n=1 Tax=Dactylosporangium sp. CS-047395 TaxID=3239936 RepID=UPI003D8CB1EF
MVAFIRNVSFDAADAYALAQFWSGVVGHPVHPECAPGDEEVVIEQPGGPRLFFQTVPEAKTVKNRVHVCLAPGDRTRDEEVARLLGLGATMVADHRAGPDAGWAVLGDPEGNEFCVTRGSA